MGRDVCTTLSVAYTRRMEVDKMAYVIFIRMSNDELITIVNTEYSRYEESIAEFQSIEQAEELMKKHSLRVFDWEIVEIKV